MYLRDLKSAFIELLNIVLPEPFGCLSSEAFISTAEKHRLLMKAPNSVPEVRYKESAVLKR